ncbi:hypothetical protein Tco_0987101, partial [Tanacetum coccineum]
LGANNLYFAILHSLSYAMSEKQSRQVQLCTKVPPSSNKRRWFGGGINIGNNKSGIMKKEKFEFINSGSRNAVVKKKNMKKGSHQIPMLDSKDLWMDKTLIRGKEHKKVTRRIVETVDLTCGENDEDWLIIPIGNQIRRLSFFKILD